MPIPLSILSDNNPTILRPSSDYARILYDLGLNVLATKAAVKHPRIEWTQFQTHRLERDTFEYFVKTYPSSDFWAIAGECAWNDFGIVVIDGDDEEAVEYIASHCPATPVMTTTRQGKHHVYRHPRNQRIASTNRITIDGTKYNIDIKADGGGFSIPGSTGKDWLTPWTRELLLSAPIYDPAWLPYEKKDTEYTEYESPPMEEDNFDILPKVRIEMAKKYLMKVKCRAGQGASAYFLRLSNIVWNDFALSPEATLEVMYWWGQEADLQLDTNGMPGYLWRFDEVQHKVNDATKAVLDNKPRGWRLAGVAEARIEKQVAEMDFSFKTDNLNGGNNANTPEVVKPKPRRALSIFQEDFLAGSATNWIADDFLPFGNLMLFAAPSKAGKTVVWLWFMRCLMAKQNILGGLTHGPLPIMYLDFENARDYVFNYANTLAGDCREQFDQFVNYYTIAKHPSGVGTLPDFLTTSWLSREVNELVKDRGYEGKGLILIDTLRGAFSRTPGIAPDWENSASGIGQLLRPIQSWCHQSGWSVVVMHHHNKMGKYSGSTEMLAASDLVCDMWRDVDGDKHESCYHVIGRLPNPIAKRYMSFDFANSRFVFLGTGSEKKDNALMRDVLNNLAKMEADRNYTAAEMCDLLALNKDLAKTTLERLTTEGRITKQVLAHNKHQYRLATAI